MKRKKLLSIMGLVFMTAAVCMMTACGEVDNDNIDDTSEETTSDTYDSSSDSSSYTSSTYDDDDSSSYSTYNSDDDSDSYSAYSSSDNYNQSNSDTYNSSSSDDYSEGHAYDKSDPFYSANDVDGDGKLTDEEWQNAMNDAITYYYYKMQEDN